MHMEATSSHRLGIWLARRYRASQKRFAAASARLQKCGVEEAELRAQWDLQIETQLKKAPSTHSQLFYFSVTHHA